MIYTNPRTTKIQNKIDNLFHTQNKFKLISKIKSSRDNIIFLCKQNHSISRTYRNLITKGLPYNCEKCIKEKQFIKILKHIKQNDGVLLSKIERTTFLNKQVVQIKCKNNHVWKTRIERLLLGMWCQKCINNKYRKYTKGNIEVLGKQQGFEILNFPNEDLTFKSKILVKCKNEHIFYKIVRSFDENRECLTCFNENQTLTAKRKYTIKDMNKVAQIRNGKFLSKKITTIHKHHKWYCNKCEGEWSATISSIVDKNSWCPYCVGSRGEILTREVFEYIFQSPFVKQRHSWIRSERNMPLELDGYNEKLKLAFEHSGKQHYEYVEFFHRNKLNFKRVQENDQRKIKLCKQNNVHLIIINQLLKETSILQLIAQIETYLIKNNLPTPSNLYLAKTKKFW